MKNSSKTLGANGSELSAVKKLLENLNPAQEKAVTFSNGPLLIVAGAGTGKTTVITRRIASLIAKGVKSDSILALTFTDKAATEMEERVDVLLPYGYHDLWISTFHSFCQRILEQHGLDIGLPNDFKLLDGIGQKILIYKNFEQFKLDYYRPLGNPTKFIGELAKHFSKLKDEEISPEQYLQFAENLKLNSGKSEFLDIDDEEILRINELANAYHVYQRLLLQNNALDFSDLIIYALQLLRRRKKILEFYRQKFQYILVDEFQDTNYAQYELVKLLALPANNINVVGDDDQSIYKFRGASVSNILQFKKDFPDAVEITLTENYRSSQNILDLAYNFIQANNPDRLESRLNINKKLLASTKDRGEVAVLSGQTAADETDLVAKKIRELVAQKKAAWNDFAILVRANDQADAFVQKFSSLGMPYTFYANKGLYKKAIISDLIHYLQSLVNHHDSQSLYKSLCLEIFKLDHADLAAILHYAHKYALSLYDAMLVIDREGNTAIENLSKPGLQTVRKFLTMHAKHSAWSHEKNVVELFINVVKDLQIARRIEDDTLENLENRELVEQFYHKIEQFEIENADKSLKNFLEQLELEQQAGEEGKLGFDPNQGPESIKIMTIHSSKGLEFNYVFVVNMVHLRFPSVNRRDPIEIPKELLQDKEILPEGDAHLQEERRLFYVAMTRAKRGLYFTYAFDYGGTKTKKPSQFLVDLGLVAKPEKSVEIMRKEKSIEHNYDPNLFLPNTFSFTHISDFLACPMRYKYRHLLHLPLEGSASLSFGQTIHATLEKFLNQYKTNLEMTQLDLFDRKAKTELPDYADLEKIYKSSWVDEWYESAAQKNEYKTRRGPEILKSFYEHFKSEPVVPKYIEKFFKMPIGNYFFNGKIDRGDLNKQDGTLQIIDYKTYGGEGRKLDKDARRQLLIYQWAASEFLNEKIGSLQYWYLLDNTFSEPFIGTNEELVELQEFLLETIEQIRHAAAHNTFKELDSKISHDCEFEELD